MMPDASPPIFTLFSSTPRELPGLYYKAMGRALYRWSQLEATVCALATSIQDPSWLQALAKLRGPNGFKVKNVLQQLNARARRLGASSEMLNELAKAEQLYSSRKSFFHSVWGHVTGPMRLHVGIQEWSNNAYDNFRPVELSELETFAADCAATSEKLMHIAIPFFQSGSSTIVVSDEDGLTRGHTIGSP